MLLFDSYQQLLEDHATECEALVARKRKGAAEDARFKNLMSQMNGGLFGRARILLELKQRH